MFKVARSVLAALSAGLIVLVLAAPAGAVTVEQITVTRAHQEASHTYKGTLKRPSPTFIEDPASQGQWTLNDCKTKDFCDAIPLSFDPDERNGHRPSFELRWPAQYGPAFDSARVYSSAGGLITELQGDAAPPPGIMRQRGQVVDLQKGNYWIAVDCISQPCAGEYTITVKINYEQGYQPPSDGSSPPPYTPPSEQPTTAASSSSSSQPAAPAPQTPGADGPLSARNLRGLPAAQQAAEPSNKSATVTNIVVGILLALILFGGGAFVAMKIRHDLGR